MVFTWVMVCMVMMLVFLVVTLYGIISWKALADREKMSPFECGFDPYGSSRLPFSIRFFLIAIIFLIFDVEIVLLLPLIGVFSLTDMSSLIIIGSVFVFILLVGLFHEWWQGALEWA